MTAPPFLTHDLLAAHGGTIAHGFFTRAGGVSSGTYASLNGGLGTEDKREYVLANRAAAANALGFDDTAMRGLYQIHSARAVIADDNADPDSRPEADGIATARHGLLLTILTADCAPCLMADPEANIIAAAHAGWRGAARGILPALITAMQSLGAEIKNIRAVIGPAIAKESYQVGGDMRDEVLAAADSPLTEAEAAAFFAPDPDTKNHFRFDLAGYLLAQLHATGIADTHCAALPYDTFSDSRFFSHRGGDGGRLMSMIGIRR